jgi:hypothetical protein
LRDASSLASASEVACTGASQHCLVCCQAKSPPEMGQIRPRRPHGQRGWTSVDSGLERGVGTASGLGSLPWLKCLGLPPPAISVRSNAPFCSGEHATPPLRAQRGTGRLAGAQRLALDAAVQIRLFEKLKLARCARAERRRAFLCPRRRRLVLFPVVYRNNRLECTPVLRHETRNRLHRDNSRPLRQPHSSGAIAEWVHCCRTVFNSQASS